MMTFLKSLPTCPLLFLLLIPGCNGDAENVHDLFFQANKAYEAEQFKEAVENYEKILAQNFVNGHVLFNLGNAYFRQGEVGKAIFTYRRAKTYLPRDADLNSNLRYARENVKDELIPPKSYPFLRKICFWYDRLNTRELLFLALILNAALWTIFMIRIFYWPEMLRWVSGLTLILTLLAAGSLLARFWGHFTEEGVVLAETLPVRSGHGASYTIRFELHAGAEFIVENEEEAWVQIRLSNGERGWVEKKDVGILP